MSCSAGEEDELDEAQILMSLPEPLIGFNPALLLLRDLEQRFASLGCRFYLDCLGGSLIAVQLTPASFLPHAFSVANCSLSKQVTLWHCT